MSKQPLSVTLARSLRHIDAICNIAHATEAFVSSRGEFNSKILRRAIRRRDNAAIYNWLMDTLSYQGVSNSAVDTILARDGNVTWDAIEASLRTPPACPKLAGFWCFSGCGYRKTGKHCAVPAKLRKCPLPRHPLRNGNLNQLAYSLYFFFRDVAGGDFIGWLDQRVRSVLRQDETGAVQRELIAPLRSVYGISDKAISLALSALLLAGRKHWRQLGARFIVVDRLVHNFLHRSGMLERHNCSHPYGPRCYGPGGCAELLSFLARGIDMRRFHSRLPQPFPRFVQFAVWRFCATGAENICNGNQIDDRRRCRNRACNLQSFCERRKLHPIGRKAQQNQLFT